MWFDLVWLRILTVLYISSCWRIRFWLICITSRTTRLLLSTCEVNKWISWCFSILLFFFSCAASDALATFNFFASIPDYASIFFIRFRPIGLLNSSSSLLLLSFKPESSFVYLLFLQQSLHSALADWVTCQTLDGFWVGPSSFYILTAVCSLLLSRKFKVCCIAQSSD